ncbi:hypothetical protein DUI87_16066 [Hirundo rustica rustica]|uniref:Uncharacterized protein n=1 Tax=Hirundo rustica rustica TaxID=333673 RepID=A0A3M0K0X8_HIRRU|nr:hypothetical protein DUI87_16066 [Hirundo rustica rustica]
MWMPFAEGFGDTERVDDELDHSSHPQNFRELSDTPLESNPLSMCAAVSLSWVNTSTEIMAELEHHTADKNVPQNALQCSMIPINFGGKNPNQQPSDQEEKMKQMQGCDPKCSENLGNTLFHGEGKLCWTWVFLNFPGPKDNPESATGGWALEQAPQGIGRGSKPDRAQEAFEQCSQAHGVILGDGPVEDQESDLMILMGPFELNIFCDPTLRLICSTTAMQRKNVGASGPEKYTEAFIKKQIEEFNLGKRHLANMMGEDPETFTQEDIDRAIAYLFPSGLFDKQARPVMKYSRFIQLLQKLVALPCADMEEKYIQKFSKEVPVQLQKVVIEPLQYDERGVAFSTGEGKNFKLIGKRKTARATAVVYDNGTGKITVNGIDILHYFPVLQDREQLLFPFQFLGRIGKHDMVCTVSGGGRSAQAGAIRLASAKALRSFVTEKEVEFMRQGGGGFRSIGVVAGSVSEVTKFSQLQGKSCASGPHASTASGVMLVPSSDLVNGSCRFKE